MIRRVHGFFRRRLSSEEYLGLHLTVGLLICLGLILAFGLVARHVVGEGSLTEWDTDVGRHLERHRLERPGLRGAFLAVTQFGSVLVLMVVTTLVALALLVRRRRLLALVWLLAMLVTGILNAGLKDVFGRERPPFRDLGVHESNESFPSGHAMGSLVAYGLLAYLLLIVFRKPALRSALVLLLSAFILTIGFSRAYLGAHYVSDVLGGFAVGGAWLAACVSGIEVVRRRRRALRARRPEGDYPSTG